MRDAAAPAALSTQSRRRLLVFAGYFHPHIGGYEKCIRELYRRLIDRGWEIDLVTCNTQGAPKEDIVDGIHVYRLAAWNLLGGTYPIPRLATSLRVLMRLLSKRYDAIITHTRFFPTSALGALCALMSKIPLIHVEHGTSHSVLANRLLCIIGKVYDHTVGTLIVRCARVNVGVSQSAADFALHLGGSHAVVIHNGVETAMFVRRNRDYRRSLGIDGNSVVIVFAGRLVYAKGVQDLVSAFSLAAEQVADIKLLIVGDGPYRCVLQDAIRKSPSGAQVAMLGQKNADELVDILSASDIFVNPSYSEGLPTSVLEAASVGLAIIATDVGGTREIIKHGDTGFLVTPGNVVELEQRLRQLLADRELLGRLGTNCRNSVAAEFRWETAVERWSGLLDEVAHPGVSRLLGKEPVSSGAR